MERSQQRPAHAGIVPTVLVDQCDTLKPNDEESRRSGRIRVGLWYFIYRPAFEAGKKPERNYFLSYESSSVGLSSANSSDGDTVLSEFLSASCQKRRLLGEDESFESIRNVFEPYKDGT